MKMQAIWILALTMVAGGAAAAAEMAGMTTDKPADEAMQQPRVNRATGVVKAVDAAAGKITLSHEAVPSIRWPAMTMAFKASPELVSSVKPGDRVDFEFVSKGMDATITAIGKAR
jgi:Cu(I)/Ag(I) efflux system periplasmic protein CusF